MYVKWSKTNIHEVNVKERNENTLKKKKKPHYIPHRHSPYHKTSPC